MARIAFVVDEDFEDSEFRKPYDGLHRHDHQIDIVGLKAGTRVTGKNGKEVITIDKSVQDADPNVYDALVIPGGYSPDHLRMDARMVTFVQTLARSGKLVAAVCHGPQLLIEADTVKGRVLTSWPSVKTDLENAGATWVDEEVHVDGKLITSRNPDDLPAFTNAIVEHLR